MKGQFIPFVFLILLLFGVVGGYIFFNIFYGTRYQADVSDIRVFNAMSNFIELLKSYLGLSLTYSGQQALRESACFGGVIAEQAWAWICDSPNPVPVETSKTCSEKFMKYYLNVYGSNFSVTIPVQTISKNFTSCLIGVEESGVFSSEYDESDFWANCTDAMIILGRKNSEMMRELNASEFITHNRFWYLFRIFTDWANANVYGNCICGKTKSCGTCPSAEQDCAERALADLIKRVDEDVECKMEGITKCCKQQTGPPCRTSEECVPWPDACEVICSPECLEPPLSESACVPSRPSILALQGDDHFGKTYQNGEIYHNGETYYKEGSILSFDDLECCDIIWSEWRLAGQRHYECDDYKYTIPSPKGPIPLKFRVIAKAAFRVEHPNCEDEVKCICPEDAADCSECTPTGCTRVCKPCQN